MSLKNSVEEILNSINSVKKIEQDFKNIFDLSRITFEENINILSNYGWYISADMEMKAIFKFNQLIKSEKQNEAEKLMLNFYKKNLNQLKSSIIVKFPERENIVKEAFIAHKKKMYYSSTILFLSQADGICGAKIFRGAKIFNNNIDMKNNPSIINILAKETALNVDTRKIDKSNYFTNLNRHSVMHGLDVNFGTEINSLKALSFLCFVSNFYNRYKK